MHNQNGNGTRRGRRPRDLPEGVTPNSFALWIKARGFTIDEVAKFFGVSRSSVYGWRRGNRPPSRATAKRIENLTEGAVLAGSWD